MDAAGGAGAREREHTHLIAATHLPDILFTHNTPSLPYTQTHTYAHTHTHTPLLILGIGQTLVCLCSKVLQALPLECLMVPQALKSHQNHNTTQQYLNNRTCYDKIVCTVLSSSGW